MKEKREKILYLIISGGLFIAGILLMIFKKIIGVPIVIFGIYALLDSIKNFCEFSKKK